MPERHTSRPPATRLLPRAGLLFALLTAAAGSVQAVPISNVPLFTATGAPSNVMLLVDNSGSMRNLITDDAYDPTASYPDWSVFCGQNGNQQCWDPDDGNIGFNELPHCATNSIPFDNDVVGGIRNGVVRCVRLPDSYGNNLTRVSGNYFNYLLENYGQNGSIVDIRNQIPDDHRLEVAKQVAINLVNANTNLRIGVSSFYSPDGQNGGPGGKIDAACGATTNTLVNAINNLDADSNTPLAETYYEITRYFQGLDGHFTDTDYTSPIIYRCQKSFVIAITDGFPTWDNDIPGDSGPNGTLPNYDGLDPETNQSDYPTFPQYSDGFQNHDGGSQSNEGYTLFLDDLAKYAFETDMRDSGNDDEGVSFNDPEFPLQNLITHTVGFTLSNQMLQDAAEYGDGTFYSADNESELTDALQAAFSDIHARSSSAASVATNTAQLSSDTFLYQARFSGSDWSGQLLAFEIQSDGTVGAEDWDAADQLPAHGSRNIRSFNPDTSSGVNFVWADLSAAQQTSLHAGDGLGQDRLDYIRGDQSNEEPGGSFRTRGSLLGDIVNSDPVFVSAQNFGFSALSGTEGTTYNTFVQAKQNRPTMIYVGANDGMLHGFDAETGVERLAYVPNKIIPQLSRLTDTNYNSSNNHRFFVDGSPRVVDAYLNSNWETVLVSTLGAGGKGVFALNVSDPANFNSSDVLWEFPDGQDNDMGVAIPQPTIVRLNDGTWAAVVANGYNSTNGNAVLFLINLENGSVIKRFDTEVGNDNGLSTPIPIDVDNDRITDFIYAGDLKGNMWKFDVTAGNANSWDVAFRGQGNTPLPLFTACTVTDNNDVCTAASRQPITAKPEVGLNPTGGFVVYFGTGRYFATGDNNLISPINSYYAIFDPYDKGNNSPNPQPVGSGRDQLLEQTVLATDTVGSEQVRITSDRDASASDKGWYIDLPVTGERQVSTPILRGGRIIFTTLIPDSDVCGFGGTSWLMEMDALSGGRLDYTPFDLNDDRQFDSDDFVTYNDEDVPVSGRQSTEGIIKTPGIITDYDSGIEFKYASGSTTGIDITVENAANATGRQSWRQLQ